jgi:hypothetical protein
VFLDRQTYEVLMPLLYLERDRMLRAGSPPVERLRWGASELLVADAYALSALPVFVDAPGHVVGFQRHAARVFPDLGLEARHDGLHLYGGWGAYYRHEFAELNRLLGGPPPCFSRLRHDPGFGSVRVDFARCLRAAAEREPSFEDLGPLDQGAEPRARRPSRSSSPRGASGPSPARPRRKPPKASRAPRAERPLAWRKHRSALGSGSRRAIPGPGRPARRSRR